MFDEKDCHVVPPRNDENGTNEREFNKDEKKSGIEITEKHWKLLFKRTNN